MTTFDVFSETFKLSNASPGMKIFPTCAAILIIESVARRIYFTFGLFVYLNLFSILLIAAVFNNSVTIVT